MQNSVAAKGRDVKHGAPQRAMCRRVGTRKIIQGAEKFAFYFCSFANILNALLICPHDAIYPAPERSPQIGCRLAKIRSRDGWWTAGLSFVWVCRHGQDNSRKTQRR